MPPNSRNGKQHLILATVEQVTEKTVDMQRVFKDINDVDIQTTDRKELDGVKYGMLLKAKPGTNLKLEILKAEKIMVVGFNYFDEPIIQINNNIAYISTTDSIMSKYLVIGQIEMTELIAIVFNNDKCIEITLPKNFKVNVGDKVIVDTETLKMKRKAAIDTTNDTISGTRLNPRNIGEEGEKLERNIKSLVVGQDQAIAPILSAYQKHNAKLLDDSKPVASVLMLGPTGTGKTRTAEALAECLLKDRRAIIKIDCAEFQHSHEIAKLIGSPPGYLGHRETQPLLSQEKLDQYHRNGMKLSIVLFDEIEKASDAVWNIMLGILDKATLTLGNNNRVNFSNTIIFCTSNLGANNMIRLAEETQKLIRDGKPVDRVRLAKDVENVGLTAARSKFSPEFINRFDKIVSFVPLMETELLHILDIELELVQSRVRERHNFTFNVREDAKKILLEKGTDMRYGARELKRTIEQYLVHPMANLIASGQVSQSDYLEVIANSDDNEYPLAFELKEQILDTVIGA